MGFLGALADSISSQFSLGENLNHSLDSIDPVSGKNVKYGSLGDFARNFDQSAERKYVEDGFLRKDPYNTDPKQFEVLFQEPNATVFVKKRMFSSINDHFRPDLMDKDEIFYYKAMRVLFQNKCAQVAALEKLSKIQKIGAAAGHFPNQLLPILLSTADDFNASIGDTGSNLFGAISPLRKHASSLNSALDKVRKFNAFSSTNPITTWITDSTNLFQSQFGQGTGVIEITNFTSLNTTVSTELSSPGSFSLSIVDPYEAMLITDYDIEKALSDASNMFYNNKLTNFAKESSQNLINDLIVRLNSVRAKRGAGPLSFKIDANTLLGKRVTVIIDRIGVEIPFEYDSSSFESIISGGAFGGGATIDPAYLKGGEIAGFEGIDTERQVFRNLSTSVLRGVNPGKHQGPDSEKSIFNRLISTIYSKISLDANSKSSFQNFNKETNYARKKLRFNFSGKLIIQPMDVVHIYMSSKSRYDEKLLSGLTDMFSGLGMMQNINNTLTGLTDAFNTLFNPSGYAPFQAEKAAFVGKDFPNFLWSTVRNSFTNENEGAHVFAGVVESAVDNWNAGKFMIEVSGKDNSYYFDLGKVNFKPGVDNFNGAFFDPLTPFKSNFDSVVGLSNNDSPELLNENKIILGIDDKDALVKLKLGRHAGTKANDCNVYSDASLDLTTGRITKMFYPPDGLVYRWKEGIGIFTQFGSSLEINGAHKVGNPNIAKEPFAGQDVMNSLSLLITGFPYNFYTYFKAANEFNDLKNDAQVKNGDLVSYAQSLRRDLLKNNALWGNFFPFKQLVLDDASHASVLQSQISIITKNKELNSQLSELRDLNQKIIILGGSNINSEKSKYSTNNITPFSKVRERIVDLQKKIDETAGELSKLNVQANFTDVEYLDPQNKRSTEQDDAERRLYRKKLNFFTRRMSYNVRANEDKNLFIVDDTYDKDLDIMAYEKSLVDGISLYSNEFTSVREKIQQAAQLLNLEVFCDTQGHIRCRSPQYNRMPSSVFYRMMYLKDTLNVQVFPKFLEDLFSNKLETIKNKIEINEDQIRLHCALLGKKKSAFSDRDALDFINQQSVTNKYSGGFTFVSDPSGTIHNISNLIKISNPDDRADASTEDLRQYNTIEKIAKNTEQQFTAYDNKTAIYSVLSEDKNQFLPKDNVVIDTIVRRIMNQTNQRIDIADYLIKDDAGNYDIAGPAELQVDVFKVILEMGDRIAERQNLIRLFYNTIKNAREFKSLDADGDNTGNRLLTPGVYGKSNIPEVFEHMIEDETYDDYGYGSGKRFIIKRAQIRSLSIKETPPPWTSVEVHGVMNPYDPGAAPPGLQSFPNGGNGMVTALGIDYDLWRNYGFKQAPVVQAPFLSDPETQCAPYAAMILARQRKNILTGTVTISGNEYMQPGEVVFIEDRQLLFYVTSVKHSFTFNSQFTTTLELSYGHSPGEYIPTYTDMIGKMIYNNKDDASIIVHRQETSASETSIGVLTLAPNTKTNAVSESLNMGKDGNKPANSFSSANAKTINNILAVAANYVSSPNTKVELRIYSYGSPDAKLQEFAESIRQILVGSNEVGLNSITVGTGGKEVSPLSSDNVSTIDNSLVDLTDDDDRRSPSQYAISAARHLIGQVKGLSDDGSDSLLNASILANEDKDEDNSKAAEKAKKEFRKLKACLFKYIVDCWIVVGSSG